VRARRWHRQSRRPGRGQSREHGWLQRLQLRSPCWACWRSPRQQGDVLGIGSPGTGVVGDGGSLPADSSVDTPGTGSRGCDVCPNTGGVLGSITIGGGIGLGTGGRGSGGGGGDLDSGVLPRFVSVHRSNVDLGSGSGALGHGNGLRHGFLCAPGGVRFSGASHVASREHVAAVLAMTTTYWVAS
jgi:hypothetical protein